jgi:ATP-dependent Clp protease adapter protein ClpS
MIAYTKQITVHLNTILQDKLDNIKNPNSYVDEVLSKYFGISYEDAYPNKERKWVGIAK